MLLGLFLPASLLAQTPVAFQVRVLYASKQPGGVDAKLSGLAKELQELQKTFGYTTFQLLDAHRGAAPLAQQWKTAIPGNRSLEIVPTASESGHHTLTVRFVRATGQVLVNSQVRLKSGATVFVGKVPHQEGDIYIAISAD
jgi:hypothetical protein